MFMPLVEAIPDISGKTITADALLRQMAINKYSILAKNVIIDIA
jgi:hypothetical protein